MKKATTSRVQITEAKPLATAMGEHVDRFLAGDLSEAELGKLVTSGEVDAAGLGEIESALKYASLVSDALKACANGACAGEELFCVVPRGMAASESPLAGLRNGVDERDDCAEEPPIVVDLSVIDQYLAGNVSRDEAREVACQGGAGHVLESEWLEALCYERLMCDALKTLGGKSQSQTYLGADQVDRYMAGDLDAAEQAELFAHSSEDSQLWPALDEARACESILRESLKLMAAGAHSELQDGDVESSPSITILDDLIDRSLAGALKQSELPLLESAAESSPAARAKILAAEQFALLMQEALGRMAVNGIAASEATEVREAKRNQGRVIQLPTGRGRSLQRQALLAAAKRRRRSTQIAAAAAVLVLCGLAGGAAWLVMADHLGVDDRAGRTPVLASGQVSSNGGRAGAGSSIEANRAKTEEAGVGKSGSTGDVVTSNSVKSADSSLVNGSIDATTPEKVPQLVLNADELPTPAKPETAGAAIPRTDERILVEATDPKGDSGSSRTGAGRSSDRLDPVLISIDLSQDLLGLRLEAFDSARRELEELRRDDGLYALWPTATDTAAEEGGRAARKLASRLSHDARISNSVAMQATVFKALAVSAGSNVSDLEGLAAGFESLAKLVKQKQEYGQLSVRDSAGYLMALEAWESALEGVDKKRKRSAACQVSAREAVKHLVRSQLKSGLWGDSHVASTYGKPDDVGTWSALVGRQVEADLLTTSAAIHGLDAATKLGINESQGQAHRNAFRAVLNLQSPRGEQVSLPVVKWNDDKTALVFEHGTTEATARGWTMIGDTVDAQQQPILRSGAATAAALSVLLSARDKLPASEKSKRAMASVNASIADGMAWLSANFSANGNPVGRDDGSMVSVSADYGSSWVVALSELAPLVPESSAGSHHILGGKPWFVELNRALLPSLSYGAPAVQFGEVSLGAGSVSKGQGATALRIAMALVALNP